MFFPDLRPADQPMNKPNHHPDELLSLHRGQGLELYWRDSLVCPTEEEYISMVNNSEPRLWIPQYVLNRASRDRRPLQDRN